MQISAITGPETVSQSRQRMILIPQIRAKPKGLGSSNHTKYIDRPWKENFPSSMGPCSSNHAAQDKEMPNSFHSPFSSSSSFPISVPNGKENYMYIETKQTPPHALLFLLMDPIPSSPRGRRLHFLHASPVQCQRNLLWPSP
ncbi:hypothetical protein J3F84DRAFT_100569 [Trichoderma pleuroticola]